MPDSHQRGRARPLWLTYSRRENSFSRCQRMKGERGVILDTLQLCPLGNHQQWQRLSFVTVDGCIGIVSSVVYTLWCTLQMKQFNIYCARGTTHCWLQTHILIESLLRLRICRPYGRNINLSASYAVFILAGRISPAGLAHTMRHSDDDYTIASTKLESEHKALYREISLFLRARPPMFC